MEDVVRLKDQGLDRFNQEESDEKKNETSHFLLELLAIHSCFLEPFKAFMMNMRRLLYSELFALFPTKSKTPR